LFVIVEENFSRIISRFSSANCKIKAHSAADSSPVAFKYKSGRAARSGRVEAHGKGERRKFSLPFSPCARPPLVLIYIYI
jgi:hypothetical protein